MKALFCVFSGTGNTLKICNRIAEELNAYGYETEIFSIRKGSAQPDFTAFGAIIIGYPVHAFNAPEPVLEFLKKLPKTQDVPAFLVRTSGEPLRLNNASGITPRRILEKRGYNVRGELAYVMPYNIIFRHSDQMAARMWRSAQLRIRRDVREMIAGQGEKCRVNIFRRLVSFTLRVEHTAMPLIGRRFRTNESCVGCGICVKSCPQSNIEIKNGRPVFGKNCVGCMACAFGCPKDAIKISLLNGWRVNGAYSFGGKPATDEEVCDYCKKSYLRYFRESETIFEDS